MPRPLSFGFSEYRHSFHTYKVYINCRFLRSLPIVYAFDYFWVLNWCYAFNLIRWTSMVLFFIFEFTEMLFPFVMKANMCLFRCAIDSNFFFFFLKPSRWLKSPQQRCIYSHQSLIKRNTRLGRDWLKWPRTRGDFSHHLFIKKKVHAYEILKNLICTHIGHAF